MGNRVWRKTRDELPNKDKKVLLFTKDNEIVIGKIVNHKSKIMYKSDFEYFKLREVPYWQNLPIIPKNKNSLRRWKSTKYDLPKLGEKVIVYSDLFGMFIANFIEQNSYIKETKFECQHVFYSIEVIDYWQKLPVPPNDNANPIIDCHYCDNSCCNNSTDSEVICCDFYGYFDHIVEDSIKEANNCPFFKFCDIFPKD